MKKIIFTAMFLGLIAINCSTTPPKVLSVSSPDGSVEVKFDNTDSTMSYSVSYKGDEIISKSFMGFQFKSHSPLLSCIKIADYKTGSYDEVWEQPWGEERLIRENYNELSVDLIEVNNEQKKLQIVFRVFNDGLGFRYLFPEQENLEYFEIMNEITEFNIADDADAWWIKAFQPERYEYLYQHTLLNDIDSIDGAHTPLTLETSDGLYLSIHEADLTDYASMCLRRVGSNKLKCKLAPWSDGVLVKANAPHKTPWRTIQIGEKPGDLVTSRLILNLNPPNKLGDVSWIKPAKYVGIWWGMHIGKWSFMEGENHGATTERAKEYIDFAAEHGFDEVLVEGWNVGWVEEWWLDDGSGISFTETTSDYDLKEVQDYAKSKGLTLQIYHETMSNTRNYLNQIDSAFSLASSLGIKTAKIGQVGGKLDKKEWHYGQYAVKYYREVLKKAAEYKISVYFHEPVKATGERRTYPNMFSREGARGMEYNAWSGDGGNPPEHTCILPFTRLLGGPMDYTPGIFSMNVPGRPINQVNTTLAKQLALYVVLNSPVQMAADLIENYRGKPAFKFIEDVPVDWETTKVIDAAIGEYVITARKDKNSQDWYLGAITNMNSREFIINLDFLDAGITYTAQIYKDAADADYKLNPEAYDIVELQVENSDEFSIVLANGGGMAVRFTPEIRK